MILIAVLGAGLAATGTVWQQVQQRAREKELLFVGQQYRRAIQQYYESGGGGRYPPTLEALLVDERSPNIRRYLRRPFPDPLTGAPDWGLVQAPQGGIMGIYSLAPGKPIKKTNFPALLNWESDLPTYAEWKFVYVPAQSPNAIPR